MTEKPSFTDVNGREVYVKIEEGENGPQLIIGTSQPDGTVKRSLVLNKYDAKQMAAVCEVYLRQQFSVSFATVDSMLTAEDRMNIYQNEIDAIEDPETNPDDDLHKS